MVRLWVKQVAAYTVAFAILIAVMLIPTGGTQRVTQSEWYQCIRPVITPPKWVFPIVWTILYALIAISLAQALLLTPTPSKWWLLCGFAVNLVLNLLWSYMYFGKKNILGSLIVILVLWLSILFIVVMSYRVHAQAWKAHILLPYLLWVTFATVLNGLSLAKQKECASVA